MYHGERLNSYSHFFGAILAMVGLIFLIVPAVQQGDKWKILSFSIYGATLVFLYSISTLYHSHRGAKKNLLRKLDHLSIYIFIAGSYMPFTLVTLRDQGGWWVFSIIWILAITGIIFEFIPQKGKRYTAIPIYLGMGWLIISMVMPLVKNLGIQGTYYLVAGGILYTVGIIFYVFDKKVRHFHGVWHLFVLAGSICHYFTVLRYVA